jgi:hypothetical protein
MLIETRSFMQEEKWGLALADSSQNRDIRSRNIKDFIVHKEFSLYNHLSEDEIDGFVRENLKL